MIAFVKKISWLRHSPDAWTVLLLLTLVIVLMLPRLTSAQFGAFDDPMMLLTAKKLLAGDFQWQDDPTAGRFRPFYWLQYALLYAVGGAQPVWFFSGNLILLAALVLSLYGFVRLAGGEPWRAGLAAGVLLFSGAVIENTVTLSKPELQQSFWLIGFLLLTRLRGATRWQQGVGFLAATGAALAACLTKETGVILPLVVLAWLLLAWVLERLGQPVKDSARRLLRWLAAAVLGAGLFFVLRACSYPMGLMDYGYGSNFTLDVGHWLSQIKAWRVWLQRDYLFLLPLLVMPLAARLQRIRLAHGESAL
jgi:hypothetical protein